MRILFYLPIADDWWFRQVVTPMLHTLHGQAELHVMIAPSWHGVGQEADHLLPFSDLDGIQWHIVDHDDPAAFRLNGASIPGLLDQVHAINPDLTLAISADQPTPLLFPGTVRFIMHGDAAPFDTDKRWVIFEEKLNAFGQMPASAAHIGEQCAQVLSPAWNYAEQLFAIEPPFGWRNQWGLPHDRPILAVPLQSEHEADFLSGNSLLPHALDLLSHLFDALDENIFLAITDHPRNRTHLDRRAVDALIATNSHRARLCLSNALPFGATGLFAARADAMLIDMSKSWSLAAFCGTPILRIGTTPIADWVAFSEDFANFPRGLRRPDRAAMRSWFGWHLGARVLNPNQFTFDELIARVNGQVTSAMVNSNLQMVLDRLPKAEAA